MLTTICYGVLWTLWKARNDRIFNNKLPSVSRTLDEVLSLVFLWFKHRGSLGNRPIAIQPFLNKKIGAPPKSNSNFYWEHYCADNGEGVVNFLRHLLYGVDGVGQRYSCVVGDLNEVHDEPERLSMVKALKCDLIEGVEQEHCEEFLSLMWRPRG
ncbi:hypothetical protein LXL04_030268 [Taraxacum kok-saghyz]